MLSYLHSNNVSVMVVKHVRGANERCVKKLNSFQMEELEVMQLSSILNFFFHRSFSESCVVCF